jgi:hypothetical protein
MPWRKEPRAGGRIALVEMAAVRLVPLAPFPAVGLGVGVKLVRYLRHSARRTRGDRLVADQFAAASEDSANINRGARSRDRSPRVGMVAAHNWLGNIDLASRLASSGAADRAYASARGVYLRRGGIRLVLEVSGSAFRKPKTRAPVPARGELAEAA